MAKAASLAQLRSTAKRFAASIKSKPNVLYVAVGLKQKGGQHLETRAIKAYVLAKEGNLPARARVPRRVRLSRRDGSPVVATDVVELTEAPRVFGARSGHVVRAFDRQIGVCGLSFVVKGRGYVLTNAHVACNMANRTYGAAELLDRPTNLFKALGPVVYWTPMWPDLPVVEDCAIIRADAWEVDPYMLLDWNVPIAAYGEVGQAMGATYWYLVNGARFECRMPEWVEGRAPIAVDGQIFNYDKFWQLHMSAGSAAPGQSGALLCRTGSKGEIIACGLVFGGVAPNLIFALPLQGMLSRAIAALG